MQNISVKSKYEIISPNPLENVMQNLQKAVRENEALSIAMIAGCPIEILFEDEIDGTKITVRTLKKISILKTTDGKVISVIQK